jgi:hypothetical protein
MGTSTMLLTFKHETLWAHQEPQRSANNAHLCATPLLGLAPERGSAEVAPFSFLRGS